MNAQRQARIRANAALSIGALFDLRALADGDGLAGSFLDIMADSGNSVRCYTEGRHFSEQEMRAVLKEGERRRSRAHEWFEENKEFIFEEGFTKPAKQYPSLVPKQWNMTSFAGYDKALKDAFNWVAFMAKEKGDLSPWAVSWLEEMGGAVGQGVTRWTGRDTNKAALMGWMRTGRWRAHQQPFGESAGDILNAGLDDALFFEVGQSGKTVEDALDLAEGLYRTSLMQKEFIKRLGGPEKLKVYRGVWFQEKDELRDFLRGGSYRENVGSFWTTQRHVAERFTPHTRQWALMELEVDLDELAYLTTASDEFVAVRYGGDKIRPRILRASLPDDELKLLLNWRDLSDWDIKPRARESLKNLVGMDAEEYFTRILAGTPEMSFELVSLTSDFGEGVFYNISANFRGGGGVLVSGEIGKDAGRVFMKELHIQVSPKARGNGFTNRYLGNLADALLDKGIKPTIQIDAAEVGSFAWLKFGAVPSAESWKSLGGVRVAALERIKHIRTAPPDMLKRAGIKIPSEETLAKIERLLESNDPKVAWILADYPLFVLGFNGKKVRIGRFLFERNPWRGTIDLSDPQALRRFNAFTRRR